MQCQTVRLRSDNNLNVLIFCPMNCSVLPSLTNMNYIQQEKMVVCPFNKRHVMTSSSLQRHIFRCMVNYPNYVVCPYNALHRFETTEKLSKHMMKCESKNKVCNLYDVPEYNANKQMGTVYVNQDLKKTDTQDFNSEDENWDET